MSKKTVEIDYDEFQELVKSLEECKSNNKKLIKTVEYLNSQIDNYNKTFATTKNNNEGN